MTLLKFFMITFINQPKFEVNFHEYSPAKEKELKQSPSIKKITVVFFESVFNGIKSSKSYLWTIIKREVLGLENNVIKNVSPNIVTTAFRVMIAGVQYFFGLTVSILKMFHTNLKNENPQVSEPKSKLDGFINEEINPAHMVAISRELSDSHVPADVKVDDLLKIFDEINFKEPDQLGFMPESSRKEGNTVYSIETFKKHLGKFVKNVNQKTPFLGTPRESDFIALNNFYQQITSAVRASIHASNDQLKAFYEENGEDKTSYNESQKKELNDILENRARIAIDLAFAGAHCGARYMGEVMQIYDSFYDQNFSQNLSLKDHLYEILDQKRLRVAKGNILEHFGNDTHAYGAYMQALGELLGLPNTINILEQLRRLDDISIHLRKFFESYTVDAIIDTIQQEFQKNLSLREKVYDWLKEQLNTWKKEEYDKKVEEAFQSFSEVISSAEEIAIPDDHFSVKFKLLIDSVSDRSAFGAIDIWDDFICEFFNLEHVKRTFSSEPMQRMALRDQLLEKNLDPSLLVKFKQMIKNKSFEISEIISELQLELKTKKALQIAYRHEIGLDQAVIHRLIMGTSNLREVLEGRFLINKQTEFLEHFELEAINDVGLTPQLLEWILVHHEIFNSQV